MHVCVQGPSPPCHETSHNLREKDYRQDRRHPRYRDADRSHVCMHKLHFVIKSIVGRLHTHVLCCQELHDAHFESFNVSYLFRKIFYFCYGYSVLTE